VSGQSSSAVKIDRLTGAPEFHKHDTGIVDARRLRSSEGVTVGRQRFFQFGLLLQRCRAIVERLRVVRLQLDRIVKKPPARCRADPCPSRRRQIIVDDRNAGIERDDRRYAASAASRLCF